MLPLAKNSCLSAELLPLNRVDQRISEAENLGFDKIIISKHIKSIAQKIARLQSALE